MVITRAQARKMESQQNMQSTSVSELPIESEHGLDSLFRENVEDSSNLETSTPVSPVSHNSEIDPLARIMMLLEQQQNQLKALHDYQVQVKSELNTKLDNQQKNLQTSLDAKLDNQQKNLQTSLDTLHKQQAELKESLARQERTLNERLAQFQSQQDSFQKQLNEKGKLWEEKSGQLQSQINTVHNTVEQIQTTYSHVPQTLSSLEENVQKLQTAHSSIESDINKLSTQFQNINIDRDNAIQEKFSAHEKIVVTTFNNWIKERDILIKQQLEQELPKAIKGVTQQIINSKQNTDEELKAEIDALKQDLAASKHQEANIDSATHNHLNTTYSPEVVK